MPVKHIGIITGGKQSQDAVNIAHAQDIGNALEVKYKITYYDLSTFEQIQRLFDDHKAKKLDIVFNNAAGKKGGDGTVEGMLEIFGIPYVGSDTLATALAFDKKSTKAIVAEAGVPIIKGVSLNVEDFHLNPSLTAQNVSTSLGYPVVVKASQGSDSIGISLVKHPRRIISAFNRAFKEDDVVLVEEFIQRSCEITCMVIGNGSEAQALQPVERVYDTELLYDKDTTDRSYRIPDCSASIISDIKRYSTIAHTALGCSDYSRSDFLVDKSGAIFFLELNAHAGLGRGGPTEYTAHISRGWDYPTLLNSILDMAVKRVSKK